jgi:hypothetical protein
MVFPGAGAGGRIDNDVALGLENPLHAGQAFLAEFGEFGPTMIHGGAVHGPKHPVRDVGRPGYLQKMATAAESHLVSLSDCPALFYIRPCHCRCFSGNFAYNRDRSKTLVHTFDLAIF